MALNDALSRIDREVGRPAEAGGYYSPEGDCFFFYNAEGPHRAVRIDGLVTIYRRDEDGAVIGFQIKGIHSLLREVLNALKNADDQIRLREMLLAAFERARQDPPHSNPTQRMKSYSDVIELSENRSVRADELQLV